MDILKQLITTHQGIAQMHTITQNLIELTKIRSEIMRWAKGFEMPENSPLPIIGRLQKQELQPKFHTALWFLKFYDFLTAKISLYITDHMSPFISAEDLKVLSLSLCLSASLSLSLPLSSLLVYRQCTTRIMSTTTLNNSSTSPITIVQVWLQLSWIGQATRNPSLVSCRNFKT